MSTFSEFSLAEPVLRVLEAEGYQQPTPIQQRAIPIALAGGDVLGIAQTGTGKTLAFAAPIITHLLADKNRAQPKSCRALVLAPTRELAAQIAESFKTYRGRGRLAVMTAFGGVKINGQKSALAKGVDVLVATPGRLEDLMAQRALTLDHVRHLVLDEADQMMDLGFIHALRRIAKALPDSRQTMFFSATMPKPIRELSKEFLFDPEEVSVTPESSTAERVAQTAYWVKKEDKPRLLAELLSHPERDQVIVFTRTKHGADRLVRHLDKAGIEAAALHGNKTQNQRRRALDAFRDKSLGVLVATDIAARGIDISGLDHVVNFELPNVPEQYVHRIGRTGRADRDGHAISLICAEEKSYQRAIEKTIRKELPRVPLPEGFVEDLGDLPPPKPGGGGRPQLATKQPGAKRPAARPRKPNSEVAAKPRRPRRSPGRKAAHA